MPQTRKYTARSSFGSYLAGTDRKDSEAGYQYGFNGKRKDDEMHNQSGSSYDFDARLYNSRLGRWMSVDPKSKKYPGQSPYNFSLNNPIFYMDHDGRDVKFTASLLAHPRVGPIVKVMQQTEIYKQLVSNFENNPNEHLSIGYGGTGDATAETGYYRNTEKNTEIFNGMPCHFIFYNKLEVYLLSGGRETDILTGEKGYDETYLAGALYHELIHANMDRYFEAKQDVCDLESKYPGVTNYVDKYGFTVKAQHEYMAANSREQIAQGMKEYDKASEINRVDDKWYKAAAWNGLTHDQDGQETQAWKDFQQTASKEEIDYINTVLNSADVTGAVKKN